MYWGVGGMTRDPSNYEANCPSAGVTWCHDAKDIAEESVSDYEKK